MTAEPMRAGFYAMLGFSFAASLFMTLAYFAFFVIGGRFLGGDHAAGETLRSIPLISLIFGVLVAGTWTVVWFLRHAPNGRLAKRSLLLPVAALVAVFVTARWSPEPSVDGGIWGLFLIGLGLLCGVAAGFTALVNLVRRRMEAAGELQRAPRLPVRRLDTASLVSVIVLIGLALAAWAVPSWTQDFNSNRGFDTPARLFSGALPPLFVMLAALLLPMLQAMPDAPRRTLFWMNATAWALTLLLALVLAYMALADSPKEVGLSAIVVALCFAWAGWTISRLFLSLYPPHPERHEASAGS